MFTTTDLFCVALLFTGFGIAIGLMAAFWRPRKKDEPRFVEFQTFSHIAPRSRREMTPAVEQKLREQVPQYGRARDSVLAAEAHSLDVLARVNGAV